MNTTKKMRTRKQSSAPPSSLSAGTRESLRRQLNTEYIVDLVRSDIRRKYLHGLGHQGAPIKYSPRVDIIDDPSLERIVALYELPGMKSSELNISIRDNFLHVQGIRSPPSLESLKQLAGSAAPTCSNDVNMSLENNLPRPPKYLTSDLRYGFFQRQIPLPVGTKDSDIVANFESGILRVTWPRGSLSESPEKTPIAVSSLPSTPTPF